ncbi:hypothetical protein ACEPAG_3876 [Sanghuangporus baumii]
MASFIYTDAVHKGIWLMSTSSSGSPQLVARNLAFVAAGIYLWEGVQCALYDFRLLCAFANRCCLGFCRAVCSVDNGHEPTSSEDDSDSKPSSCLVSQESTQSRFRISNSWVSNSAFPVFNAIAQFAYILLRITTFLALLSILVILNSFDDTTLGKVSAFPISICTPEEENESSNSWCRIRLALMLGRAIIIILLLKFTCDATSYVLTAFVGFQESRTVSGLSGGTGRRGLVIGTFTYCEPAIFFSSNLLRIRADMLLRVLAVLLDALAVSLAFIGIVQWRNLGCDHTCMYKEKEDLYKERSSSPVFAHPCGHPPRSDCATEGGESSYGTLSDMSFAQKSNICTSDSEETDSETSTEGNDDGFKGTRRLRSPKSSVDRKSLDCGTGDVSRNGTDRITPLAREYPRENKAEYADWVERTSEAMMLRRIRRRGVESRVACSDESRVEKEKGRMPSIGSVILTEGRHQGLLWMSASMLMKIGVLTTRTTGWHLLLTSRACASIRLLVSNGSASILSDTKFCCLSSWSLILKGSFVIAIGMSRSVASGRLFLLMTRASPIGDGYMEARDPPPPWSPSASLLDVGIMTPPVAEDRPRRQSLSYQAKPISLVRLDVLPAYVERRLYTRRVRHEREAALRTIGGSVILPPPALVPVGSKITQEKRKKAEGGTSVQIPDQCAGMSRTRSISEPERKGCSSYSTN